MRLLLLITLAPLIGFANPHAPEVERALIERDQRSAEFAAPGREERRGLENLHERQRREPASRGPDERQRMARERDGFILQLPAPASHSGSDPELKPLPLPGGPQHGVEPVPRQGVGG